MSIYLRLYEYNLYGACYLAAAEASRTDIDVTRGTVNDRLNALYIGFPCTIAASVRMAHLNAERNAFITKFTFSHLLHLLVSRHNNQKLNSFIIIAEQKEKSKQNFKIIIKNILIISIYAQNGDCNGKSLESGVLLYYK